ncbi:MAG TPA: peptidylprolyl isomerase [Chthoniobacterales bacterium]|jgi:cyclophilin family peptidyl-prolyl cis-trans isomerase
MERCPLQRIFSVVSILVVVVLMTLPARGGTKVRIATTIGNIDFELYDQDKPVTVTNFLRYLKAGRYSGCFLHRLSPGFVLQGGGYGLTANPDGTYAVTAVEAYAPIVNEFSVGKTYSNTYGTIAMAKLPAEDGDGNPVPGGGPDSATSEWFLNLADNSASLDSQNGGFTVFGRVIAGFDVLALFNTAFVDEANDGVGVYNASGALGNAFTNLPLLANGLNTDNLVFSEIMILPETSVPILPSIAIKGAARLSTGKSILTLKGTASSSVAKIEWRLGKKGKFRLSSAGSTWKLRVKGLEMGKNIVTVRGVGADGVRGAPKKLRILRK